MEREGMEGNNLLHFLDTPSNHYRRTCDGFEAERDGDDHSDASGPCHSGHSFASSAPELIEVLACTYQRWPMDFPLCSFFSSFCSAIFFPIFSSTTDWLIPKFLFLWLKVISVNLDEWTDEEVNCLTESGGNSVVNKRYEAFLPENKKLKQDCSTEERNDFIRKKYQFQQFVCDPQFSCPLPLNKKHAPDKHPQQSNKHGFGHAFRNSWRKKDSDNKGLKKMSDVGMIEFVGLIKVNIVKGTDLAVRDVMSSDPYVMINLGHQSMKTKVIKNTLNPIWNERLMLSIPDPIPPLKLQVFDKDTFSSDDRMGEADVDIRPLIAATKEHENSTITELTELYRWSASEDINGVLAKDSVISIANGNVKQEITLKLQNVERGEVEIEIECVPLSQ
ncbi:putative ADP-ribosylation factor GTPase-activating protein AGD11 [Dichanthelium oligosanthes]|uniref:Putative ADP-ribosylation factor GTPase-activating protein AGD11 n=1 Tax=Dichanthelium oligosanthes TaxID=888268 RepID=A0A1E5W4H2_9POAL|nr:putative ADP-ribosylation factor GTPase-activating protein AGD11 [Dichanthelium oligosanthes]